MNPNIYLYPCAICQTNFPSNFVLQLPCCSPSPFFCYECAFSEIGLNCFVCGNFWGIEQIKQLVKNTQMKQHQRNRSEIINPTPQQKPFFQNPGNKSYNPNRSNATSQIENISTGGAFISDDLLEMFKKKFPRNNNIPSKDNFFGRADNQLSKQSFFSQNFSNNPYGGSTTMSSTRENFFFDEINENNLLETKYPSYSPNIMQSVVTRDQAFKTPNIMNQRFNNFQDNRNKNPNLNEMNMNPLASAPHKMNLANDFNESLSFSDIFQSGNNRQQQQANYNDFNNNNGFNPNINARFNNNMNEAQYLKENMGFFAERNADAMAIEVEPISDFNNLNLNSEETGGVPSQQQFLPPQSIHINNVSIQNSNLNNQFTTYLPQTFSFGDRKNDVPGQNNSMFFKNQEHNSEMRNSHIFGQLSPFPDKRNQMRRSVSPNIQNRKNFDNNPNANQLTPKANLKIQETLEKLEMLGTKKKPLNYNGFISRNEEN